MRNKILIAAALILPLLQACDRSERSPSASIPGSDTQARTPSAQDRMLEGTPPAAGVPATPNSPPGGTSGSGSTPGSTGSGSSTNPSGDSR